MLQWLTENLATVLVSAALLGILGLVIFIMLRNKKQGKKSCGCGCKGCAFSESCHQK